jgi:hypothetical protein
MYVSPKGAAAIILFGDNLPISHSTVATAKVLSTATAPATFGSNLRSSGMGGALPLWGPGGGPLRGPSVLGSSSTEFGPTGAGA